MKICVTGTRGFPFMEGGVENHCEALYPLMDSEAEIIVFRRKPYLNKQNKNAKYNNIRFIDLPSTKVKGLEALLHSFLSALRILGIRPDIVHIHNIGPAVFSPLFRLSGAKIVLTYHSANYEHDKWSPAAKKLLKLSEKIAFKYSDKIIFVNSFKMRECPKKAQKKAVYIPNGVAAPSKAQGSDMLEKFALKKGKYILGVGRITPEKGFDTLIKAFYESAATKSDYKLVIAGGVVNEAPHKKELDALVKDNRVVFTDYINGDKLAQIYENAGMFVLSSRNEGFPLVLLEAMGYGLKIAASDIPGAHLVSLPDDCYFEVNNASSLAEVINKKLGSDEAPSYDLAKFRWQDIANQTEAIYKELLKETD